MTGIERHWAEAEQAEHKAIRDWRCPSCGQRHPLAAQVEQTEMEKFTAQAMANMAGRNSWNVGLGQPSLSDALFGPGLI